MMSRNWAVVLVAVTFLSVGALLGTLIAPRPVAAAKDVEAPAPRIAFVNIAKVLREFKKATADGSKVAAKRQEYVEKMKPLRAELEAKSNRQKSVTDPTEKQELANEVTKLRRKVEDLDREAQKILEAMTDKTIVNAYRSIQVVIAELAKERGLDVVECYPDSSNPLEASSPAVAKLKLQTPALMPYYARKELFITDDVIEMLNEKYPPKQKEDE